jgi:predicted RND superfamily exporter protein
MLVLTKKNSKIIVATVLIATVLFVTLIAKLRFNYDFENFFSQTDEETKYYMNFRQNFENDSDYCLIGIENKKGIFQPNFLKKVDSMCTELRTVEYMEGVQSVTNAKTFLIGEMGITPIKLIHLDNPSKLKDDSINIYSQREMVGTFVSLDGKALSVYVKKENMVDTNKKESMNIRDREKQWLHDFEKIVAKYQFDDVHIAGRIKAEDYYIAKMEHEIIVFIFAGFFLVVIVLWLTFKQIWGVLVPTSVVLLSAIWSMGMLAVLGKNVDVMTSLLPSIIFIIAMSDVVHFVSKYLQLLRQGLEKEEAIHKALKEVGLATFLTAFTASIGFATLVTIGIEPIENFGIYTAIGIILTYIIAHTFLPAMLMLLPAPTIVIKKENHVFWTKNLHRLFHFVIRNRKTIMASMFIIVGVAIYGCFQMRVNAQLVDEVKEGDPLKDDFIFFEKHFSGVRPFEVALETGKNSKAIDEQKTLLEIEKLEDFLVEKCNINQIASPTTAYRIIHRGQNNGDKNFYSVPSNPADFKEAQRYYKKAKKIQQLGFFISKDKKMGRINGLVTDIGSERSREIESEFATFVQKNIDTTILKPRLTGSAYLIDNTNDNLSVNLVNGLTLSVAVIAVIMFLLFRNWRMVLVAIIPNVIPMLIVGAIIGYFDIGLKISTGIIFSIAFGIAEDDTIHFMSKFKIELSRGKSYLYAMKSTFLTTGKAVIVTSIILVAGFMTLMYSDFKGSFLVGLLISLTLFFAVLSDLFFVPILLLALIKNKHVEKMRSFFRN